MRERCNFTVIVMRPDCDDGKMAFGVKISGENVQGCSAARLDSNRELPTSEVGHKSGPAE